MTTSITSSLRFVAYENFAQRPNIIVVSGRCGKQQHFAPEKLKSVRATSETELVE